MGWEVAVSAATAVVVTLLGVAAGAWVTERSQKRTWSRNALAEACATLVQEQTATYMALMRWRSEEIERVDWTGWNAALARVQLVAPTNVVNAALSLDTAFWHFSDGIRDHVDETGWCQLRDEAQQQRLDFVNLVRQHLAPSAGELKSLVGRPSRSSEQVEAPAAIRS
ncbi:hypothetical protein [Micromonospora sp. NPDC049891]|uniref:hypothetical protein n=1 Tax=Micromonospora sp. NPDC049891 TaxID=3155655 RepID=UPI0033EAEBED